jgi:hypothetical protein
MMKVEPTNVSKEIGERRFGPVDLAAANLGAFEWKRARRTEL